MRPLGAYVDWARTHDSLLVITWDEDDHSAANRIPTMLVGPMVRPGRYVEHIDHDTVLSTLAAMYGAAVPGLAAQTPPITDIWTTP